MEWPLTSQELISHSKDLKLLRDQGYEIEVSNGHLLIHNIPYVNSDCSVLLGTLVSQLELAGEVTTSPSNHICLWVGQYPCKSTGQQLSSLVNNDSIQQEIKEGVIATHSFSQKPEDEQGNKINYKDYHQKMTAYIDKLENEAKRIYPNITSKTFRVIESDEDESVFNYVDTSSSRAGIISINKRLNQNKIAIVGLGGTGSYILDLVAKTEVQEIHLFDDDAFLQHNAFRSPGAPTIEELSKQNSKTDHFAGIYSNMRRNVISHSYSIDKSNISELDEMDTVFLCVDNGKARKMIGKYLLEKKKSFIDVGIGLLIRDESITGSLRITTCTDSYDLAKDRLHFSDNEEDEYSTNIQISDMNALNASLAVIKWKKMCGFYHDLEKEHHTVYSVGTNTLSNEITDREEFDES